MRVGGLQKLTLLDYPGKTACTIFTWGCNLRCPFCHNASLVTRPPDSDFTVSELYAFLQKRRDLLDGVCITGGEPLLQQDLLQFLRPIHDMGYAIKLDTNGTLPAQLATVCESGFIDMVAMDIKNAPEKYAVTTGSERVQVRAVCESVSYLLRGSLPYEFRTTVVKRYHEDSDFVAIGQWLRGASAYFLQGFQDSGDLIDGGLTGCTPAEMQHFLEIVQQWIPQARLRGL